MQKFLQLMSLTDLYSIWQITDVRSMVYREVGELKDQVNKNGRCYDMIILELHSSDWKSPQDKYSKYMVEFE